MVNTTKLHGDGKELVPVFPSTHKLPVLDFELRGERAINNWDERRASVKCVCVCVCVVQDCARMAQSA